MRYDMLQIRDGWIIITIGRIAAWIIFLRGHLQRCVLSKAPVPYALLKTRRIVMIYSHDSWTNIRGQINEQNKVDINS
jgi:hypothetical protein